MLQILCWIAYVIAIASYVKELDIRLRLKESIHDHHGVKATFYVSLLFVAMLSGVGSHNAVTILLAAVLSIYCLFRLNQVWKCAEHAAWVKKYGQVE